jgi:hypothetical protein
MVVSLSKYFFINETTILSIPKYVRYQNIFWLPPRESCSEIFPSFVHQINGNQIFFIYHSVKIN